MREPDPRAGSPTFEVAATLVFIVVLALCIGFGGPAHLASTGIICLIYFLFGMTVVRKGLLAAGMLAFPLSLFGDPHSGDAGNIHVDQVGLWLGTAVVWIPSMLFGYFLRTRIDRRRGFVENPSEQDRRPSAHVPRRSDTAGTVRTSGHFPPPPPPVPAPDEQRETP